MTVGSENRGRLVHQRWWVHARNLECSRIDPEMVHNRFEHLCLSAAVVVVVIDTVGVTETSFKALELALALATAHAGNLNLVLCRGK